VCGIVRALYAARIFATEEEMHMGRKKESVLAQSASAKRALKISIDPDVDDELQALNKRLETETESKKVFDVAAVITPGLRRAIKAANQELDDLAKGQPRSGSQAV
jgi:hypothetical protein